MSDFLNSGNQMFQDFGNMPVGEPATGAAIENAFASETASQTQEPQKFNIDGKDYTVDEVRNWQTGSQFKESDDYKQTQQKAQDLEAFQAHLNSHPELVKRIQEYNAGLQRQQQPLPQQVQQTQGQQQQIAPWQKDIEGLRQQLAYQQQIDAKTKFENARVNLKGRLGKAYTEHEQEVFRHSQGLNPAEPESFLENIFKMVHYPKLLEAYKKVSTELKRVREASNVKVNASQQAVAATGTANPNLVRAIPTANVVNPPVHAASAASSDGPLNEALALLKSGNLNNMT